MNTYAILRRNGWRTPEDLEAAALRSRQIGDEQMPDDVRWIRSYVLAEDGRHARDGLHLPGHRARRRSAATPLAAELPVDEIIAVADTVIVRPDPRPPAASMTSHQSDHHRRTRTRRCGRKEISPASLRPCARAARRSWPRSAITAGLDVLDLGCGDGTTAMPAAQLGANVLGVDIAENLVAAGNARAQQLGLDQHAGSSRATPPTSSDSTTTASTSWSASSARCSRRGPATLPGRWCG